VLFTSYKTLNETAKFLSAKDTGVKVLRQGETSKWNMLNIFKKTKNSVLLGVNTFWQGVDIPGKALECVVIFKLPFSVPDESRERG